MQKRVKILETPEIPKDPEAFRGRASSDLVVRLRHHHLPILRDLTEAGQHCEAKPRQMRQQMELCGRWEGLDPQPSLHPSSTKGYPFLMQA